MEADIVVRLLELAKPGASFDDVGGVGILKEAADHILAARACAEMMLQGTGQKLGEELARRVMDEHYQPRWIPVEERLPKRGEFVIVAKESGAVCESRHDGNGEFYMHESRLYPSHWMPLPEPPEVK